MPGTSHDRASQNWGRATKWAYPPRSVVHRRSGGCYILGWLVGKEVGGPLPREFSNSTRRLRESIHHGVSQLPVLQGVGLGGRC